MVSALARRALGALLPLALAMSWSASSHAVPPVTPDGFRYEIYSDTTAELFWRRTTNVFVQGYELTRNGESLGVFDALSYVDGTLTPGIDYTYTIRAVGGDGDRSGTSTVSLRTPRTANTIAMLQRRVDALEDEIDVLESSVNDGVRSPVPRTGQTMTMRTGDDGDVQAGVAWPDPRFTVNVDAADDLDGDGACDAGETCDGTVTDNLTGLVWLQGANCFGELSWSDAIDGADALAGDVNADCGLRDGSRMGDWRLPNVKEILSLLDYSHAFPTPLLPTDHPFSDVQIGGITDAPASYWTSTSTGGSGGAYTVSVSVGWVERISLAGSNSVSFLSHAWPVRDRR